MRKSLIFLLLLIVSPILTGQDIHLSQYYFSPMLTNPALTGKHDGTMRFVANQRQQWRSMTVPYNTFAISAETNRIGKVKSISTGISILNDKAGDSRLNTLQVNLGGAFVFSVNPDSTALVRLGTQLGYTQKKIDFTDLRFNDQYNGNAFDPSLPNNEGNADLKTGFTNLHLGIDFGKKIDNRQSFGMGIAIFNLLTPNYSYFDDNTSKRNERLSTQLHYQRKISKDMDILLSSQMMWQGSYQEKVVGVLFKKIWYDTKILKRAGYIGGFMRHKDSGYIQLAMDYDDWKFGLSYDINYSPLHIASRYRGGLELSVIYILDIFNETIKPHRACPDFI